MLFPTKLSSLRDLAVFPSSAGTAILYKVKFIQPTFPEPGGAIHFFMLAFCSFFCCFYLLFFSFYFPTKLSSLRDLAVFPSCAGTAILYKVKFIQPTFPEPGGAIHFFMLVVCSFFCCFFLSIFLPNCHPYGIWLVFSSAGTAVWQKVKFIQPTFPEPGGAIHFFYVSRLFIFLLFFSFYFLTKLSSLRDLAIFPSSAGTAIWQKVESIQPTFPEPGGAIHFFMLAVCSFFCCFFLSIFLPNCRPCGIWLFFPVPQERQYGRPGQPKSRKPCKGGRIISLFLSGLPLVYVFNQCTC